MPQTSTGGYEEIDYGIIFLVKEQVMYGFMDELTSQIDLTQMLILISIAACLTFFFLLIIIIVLIFSRGITKPIQALTDFTQELKKAENKEDKQKVIDDVKKHPHFSTINEEY